MFKKRITRSNRTLGDNRRAKKDWAGAAEFYRQHLLDHPDDAGIWVQLGHAQREQSLLFEAAESYGRAAALCSSDPDPLLHLAHTEKLLGRWESSATSFELLMRIDPKLEHKVELRALHRRLRKRIAHSVGEGAILFSIQDLMDFLRAHPTMSGIQRVQAGIALQVIADPTIDAHFILIDQNAELQASQFWRVNADDLAEVINYASGSLVDHEQLRELISQCEAHSEVVTVGKGSIIILLGAFWALGNSVSHYVTAKRNGARIGAYLYDIIPISHPQYCDISVVRDFTLALAELCVIADFRFDYLRLYEENVGRVACIA